jgi:hypothetical protein
LNTGEKNPMNFTAREDLWRKDMEKIIDGTPVVVDPEHAHLLEEFDWKIDDNGYALTFLDLPDGKTFPIRLHQLVIGWVPRSSGLVTDHKNRIKTDCRKENLHHVTRLENLRNSDYFKNRGKC